MRALTLWTGTGLKREMDRLFERFFESPWTEVPALGDWTPCSTASNASFFNTQRVLHEYVVRAYHGEGDA
jgi:hypothetical protein